MRPTDLFVERPVLAVVVSTFVLLLGLEALTHLPIRQFPKTVNATIEIETVYYGADADVVAGFMTTPIENAVAHVEGVDYIFGQSTTGDSQVNVHMRLNEDPDRALAEIQTRVSSISNQLPPGSQVPSIRIQTGDAGPVLFAGYTSKILSPSEVTDYLKRIVAPVLQSLDGVQDVHIWGAEYMALRAWLDPARMAAHGVTAADVSNAMQANNFVTGAGQTKGEMSSVTLDVNSSLHSADGFRSLVIKQANGAIIRLGDVARVELGSEDYDSSIMANGKPSIFVAIEVLPTANVLDVVSRARAKLAELDRTLPQGIESKIEYDATIAIRESIREVAKTLAESLAIVTLVVFLFLRSARATLIPVVTIPLSLVGTFTVLSLFGYSINLLTLLALVLATGLVVDDAIIVVENVSREMAEGASPREAALRSARQLASPIVAMTIVLVAVYVPIALRSGLTGALFTEFAVTMVGSVTVSALLALTLSPVMCRFFLRGGHRAERPPFYTRAYRPALHTALSLRFLTILLGAAVLASCVVFYRGAKSELSPVEDEGFIAMQASAPPTATIDYMKLYERQVSGILDSIPETDTSFIFDNPGGGQGGLILKPGDQRHRTTAQVQAEMQRKLAAVAGENIALFIPPSLPGAYGLPVEYVLKTTGSFEQLDGVSQEFLRQVQATGLFAFADRDLKIDLPKATVVVDRDKVAALGLDMTRVGNVLNTMLSGGYINYFPLAGRSYKVIPEVERSQRLTTEQLGNYTIADMNGVPVPLSAVAHIETKVAPESIIHVQQMNATTIQAVPMPGVSQAEALAAMNKIAARVLPTGYATDATGPLRQFERENGGFLTTFAFAVVVIYLALAALFGSFRDPLIILVSVPMSLAGALAFIWAGIGGATLNIYAQVGLVTLMGLISKHGILMVEVANEQQALGETKRAAITHAALLRLRPILMTTAAMVLGVAPLVFASGAGAAARYSMGLVIAAGLSVGTVFTLLVVPAFYLLLARTHRAEPLLEARAAELHPVIRSQVSVVSRQTSEVATGD